MDKSNLSIRSFFLLLIIISFTSFQAFSSSMQEFKSYYKEIRRIDQPEMAKEKKAFLKYLKSKRDFFKNNKDDKHNEMKYSGPLTLLLKRGYQESLWNYKKAGKEEDYNQIYNFTKAMLQKGRVLRMESVSGQNISEVYKVELEGGLVAYWKPELNNPNNNYKHEVAAFLLDDHLELGRVPITVDREINGVRGSLQLGVHYTEAIGRFKQVSIDPYITIFDYIIKNTDRHLTNWGFLYAEFSGQCPGQGVAIDHTLSFYVEVVDRFSRKGLIGPPSIQVAAEKLKDRPLFLKKLKQINDKELFSVLKDYLSYSKIKSLIVRKNRLIKRTEKLLKKDQSTN